MPIVLVQTQPPRTVEHSGVVVTYRVPAADGIAVEIRRASRRMVATPNPTDAEDEAHVEISIGLLARYIESWTGVVDAAGTPVQWPEAGRTGVGPTGPSPEGLRARDGLLRALTFGALDMLAGAIRGAIEAAGEAAASSGKGSPSG